MKKTRLLFLFLIFLFTACNQREDADDSGFSEKIVVEGWIENGDVAHVLLTKSKFLITSLDSTSIQDIVIRWAKVSVSDGETTEILTGRIDTNYFPPFLYRGSLLTGKAGKTYTLKIEYSNRIWIAETRIPEPVGIQELSASAVPDNDTLYRINATFRDPGDIKNYYKFFARVHHKNNRYLPSVMGNADDNLFSGQERNMPVNKGIEQAKIKEFIPEFTLGDTVDVKFCTMPGEGFRFWTGYENEILHGQNPFFPATRNLYTNIPEGLGLWCGYGTNIYTITYNKKEHP